MSSDLAPLTNGPYTYLFVVSLVSGAANAGFGATWLDPPGTVVFTPGTWTLVTLTVPGSAGTATLYYGGNVLGTKAGVYNQLTSGSTLALRLGNVDGWNTAGGWNGLDGR